MKKNEKSILKKRVRWISWGEWKFRSRRVTLRIALDSILADSPKRSNRFLLNRFNNCLNVSNSLTQAIERNGDHSCKYWKVIKARRLYLETGLCEKLNIFNDRTQICRSRLNHVFWMVICTCHPYRRASRRTPSDCWLSNTSDFTCQRGFQILICQRMIEVCSQTIGLRQFKDFAVSPFALFKTGPKFIQNLLDEIENDRSTRKNSWVDRRRWQFVRFHKYITIYRNCSAILCHSNENELIIIPLPSRRCQMTKRLSKTLFLTNIHE
jgi:hypothetical protein